MRVGPDVTPPRLLRKVEPKYSGQARADHVQGTVVFQLVVNEQGHPTELSVISPLGFGLDEQAQAALEKWEFAPGTKDGKPVKVLATVEVNFRFPTIWFDEKAEHQRTAFNLALKGLKQEGKPKDRAIESMQDLCKHKLPAAMHMVGMWQITGQNLAKDPAGGLALVEKAAEKDYGPALYEVAIREIEGRDLPADAEKGMETMRQAAVLGSIQAQLYLGLRYEKGQSVPADAEHARRYFRLCASKGSRYASTGWVTCCSMRLTARNATTFKGWRGSACC